MSKDDILYEKALRKWGLDSQLSMVSEECLELALAVRRFQRGRLPYEESVRNILEETADVEIMCKQIRMMFGGAVVDSIKQQKLRRLRNLVEKKS